MLTNEKEVIPSREWLLGWFDGFYSMLYTEIEHEKQIIFINSLDREHLFELYRLDKQLTVK